MVSSIDARSFFASDGILLFVLAVVGVVYSWNGAIVAGILFKLNHAVLNDWVLFADLALILFGAVLLHAIMTATSGVARQLLGPL